MSVLIDSIDVTGLIKEDLFPTGIQTVSEISSAGSQIIYERPILFFQSDLLGGADFGWLTLSVMESLQVLAKVIGASYVLNYEGTLTNVRFRTEEPPVVYGEKLINRSNQITSDYYNNIVLKLMEV